MGLDSRGQKVGAVPQSLFAGMESVPQLPLVLSKASGEAVELVFI